MVCHGCSSKRGVGKLGSPSTFIIWTIVHYRHAKPLGATVGVLTVFRTVSLPPVHHPFLANALRFVDIAAAEQPYALVFAPQVKDHLHGIERKPRSLIRYKIDEQLQ
jgi:hypothetical protein